MVKLDIDNFWVAEPKDNAPDITNVSWLPKVCIDGKIIDAQAEVYSAECLFAHRGLYIDQWFVSRGDEPYMWGETYNSLISKAEALLTNRITMPTAEHLLRQVKRLTSHNHYPPFSRFCFTFFCQPGDTLSIRWILRQERLKGHPYTLIDSKIFVSDNQTPMIVPSALSQASVWPIDATLANEQARHDGYTTTCLRNTRGTIATTTLGSLFLLSGRTAVTPSFGAGSPRDTLRPYVLRALIELGYQCHESDEITTETMQATSECFVTNVGIGVQPITGFGTLRYHTDKCQQVAERVKGYFY